MGSLPSELSLDLRPTFVPKTIANILYNLSTIQTTSDQLSSLHDYLSRFEDELRKIDAFKRELPLCVLLLNDAISVLKEELEKCRAKNTVPVLEEFIPLKKVIDQNEENNNNDDVDDERDKNNECRDKKNWMSSVQLWNNTTTTNNNNASNHKLNYHDKLETKKREGQSVTVTVAEDPFQSCSSNRNGGSAFTPFSTYSSVPVTTVTLAAPKEEKEETVMNNRLSLLIPGVKNLREGFGLRGSGSSTNRAVSSSPPPTVQTSLRSLPHQPQQTARKQRRCWSPELHRRFVNALQKLGGSQATPKQIRELMQVDGLTNDEVKSHLQKYRLHTRRVPAGSGNQSAVVLGGLWTSQEHYNHSSKGSSSASGSPNSPLHLATESRGGTSPTDSMEDDEDAKSESYSWKSHTHRPGKVGV